ncbi:MAG: hypothetical protein EOO61_01865, partial [Hymenobacter sp.]
WRNSENYDREGKRGTYFTIVEDFDDPGVMNYNLIEILFYNMRHVQHHAAQLNLMLRQDNNNAAGWVFRSDDTGIS